MCFFLLAFSHAYLIIFNLNFVKIHDNFSKCTNQTPVCPHSHIQQKMLPGFFLISLSQRSSQFPLMNFLCFVLWPFSLLVYSLAPTGIFPSLPRSLSPLFILLHSECWGTSTIIKHNFMWEHSHRRLINLYYNNLTRMIRGKNAPPIPLIDFLSNCSHAIPHDIRRQVLHSKHGQNGKVIFHEKVGRNWGKNINSLDRMR